MVPEEDHARGRRHAVTEEAEVRAALLRLLELLAEAVAGAMPGCFEEAGGQAGHGSEGKAASMSTDERALTNNAPQRGSGAAAGAGGPRPAAPPAPPGRRGSGGPVNAARERRTGGP